jgi:hypothetical protein
MQREAPSATPFPPDGPVALSVRPAPEAGLRYRIVSLIEGEQDVEPPAGRGRKQNQRDSQLVELHYRRYPTRAPQPGEAASVLVLEAARHRVRQGPPAHEREVELANDRLQIRDDGKVGLDLRGAQPRENLTPRMLLERPFAVLRQDPRGDPLGIVIRGAPAARSFLRPLSARALIGWTRLARPDMAVSAGARWTARRFPPHAVGALGLALELHYQLAGFEKLDGVACAWIVIRGDLDAEGVRSQKGFRFDRAVAHVEGEAWVELANSAVRRLVLEDEVRASYGRGEEPNRVRVSLRHRSRTVLERSESPETGKLWADGSPHFGER